MSLIDRLVIAALIEVGPLDLRKAGDCDRVVSSYLLHFKLLISDLPTFYITISVD